MGAVTYPDTQVAEFLNKEFVPVQVPFDSEPLATDFTLRWTPTLIVLDDKGKEHARVVGFVSPREFIPTFLLGAGKAYFDLKDYRRTTGHLERIINTYSKSFAAPEAIYYQAVCGYKVADDAAGLKRAYERILADYPDSEWVQRASPYRLL